MSAKWCASCATERTGSQCRKCGGVLTEIQVPDWEPLKLPNIERIRELAREVGYGLGVHGSLERDLDLIAIPWVDTAASPTQLADHIAKGMNARVLTSSLKPAGRWACNIQIDGWYKIIDLSVMGPVR